jgi:hypothetical protein
VLKIWLPGPLQLESGGAKSKRGRGGGFKTKHLILTKTLKAGDFTAIREKVKVKIYYLWP